MQNNSQLKSFAQFLRRNKLYTAVNIFGFALSLMFVVTLALYLSNEISADQQHEHKDRIYRMTYSTDQGPRSHLAAPAPARLQERFPEIETTVRMIDRTMKIVPENGELFVEQGFLADTTFFDVFTLKFLEGSSENAFKDRQQVVLSHSFARKLFGTAPALGQTLKIDEEPYIVSAVTEDIQNSHLKNFTVMMPFMNLPKYWYPEILNDWGNNSFLWYIKAAPNTNLQARAAEVEEFMSDPEGNFWMFREKYARNVYFEPLSESYLSTVPPRAFQQSNDRRFLNTLLATTLLILAFAMINYINLSVAQAGFRARESSVRRLLGGTRWQLFSGFITESIIICTFSLLLGIGLGYLFNPLFNKMLNTTIQMQQLFSGTNLLIAAGGILVLGILAGIVPALTVSSYKPIDIVRGEFVRKTKMFYSRVLISFQYCITIVLIGCTIVIVRQVNYMKSSDLGFEKTHLMTFLNVFGDGAVPSLRDQLEQIPGVEKVSFASFVPPGTGNNNTFMDDNGVQHSTSNFFGDSLYIDMMGFEIVHRTGVTDRDGVWLNETAWKNFGLSDDDISYTVGGEEWFKLAGRLKDFHFQDLSSPIGEAIVRTNMEGWFRHVLVRVSSGDPFRTLKAIENAVNERASGNVFDGQFMDQRIQHLYEKQDRTSIMLGSLSVLAIVISALGILAMATYFMQQRSKEVAVRKVFGAMTKEVLALLMLNFLKLVAVAFVIAIPIIVYVMRRWLAEYPYRISVTWDIIALAGVIALLIAGLTVLVQSWKAANANPILSIKD